MTGSRDQQSWLCCDPQEGYKLVWWTQLLHTCDLETRALQLFARMLDLPFLLFPFFFLRSKNPAELCSGPLLFLPAFVFISLLPLHHSGACNP